MLELSTCLNLVGLKPSRRNSVLQPSQNPPWPNQGHSPYWCCNKAEHWKPAPLPCDMACGKCSQGTQEKYNAVSPLRVRNAASHL
jgi:hypothetical protein